MKFNLDELEQLAAKATPGPWTAVVSNKYAVTVVILPPDFPQAPLVGRIRDEQDAAYIVASCNAVPELIKMYREADDKANKAWEILLKAQAHIVELQKRARKLEKALIELVKIEVPLPECAVCWERDKCTDHAHGDNCLAIGYIIDTAMEATKEAGNELPKTSPTTQTADA